MLSLFHKQERVQEKLIEAQARLAQQEAKTAAAVMPSEAYLYVGLNHGLSVWGHADIVAASIDLDGEAGPQAKHT